jgi:hypothetical protein
VEDVAGFCSMVGCVFICVDVEHTGYDVHYGVFARVVEVVGERRGWNGAAGAVYMSCAEGRVVSE